MRIKTSTLQSKHADEIEITCWDDGDVTLEAGDACEGGVYLFIDIGELKTAVDEVFIARRAFNKGRDGT